MDRPAPDADAAEDDAPDEAEDPWLRCAGCRAPICRRDAEFQLATTPTFANPAGYVYTVFTVLDAQGLAVAGRPTTRFTWFAGYAWRVAGCATCDAHLGWRFDAVSGGTPAAFWGLLRDRVVP